MAPNMGLQKYNIFYKVRVDINPIGHNDRISLHSEGDSDFSDAF